MNGLLIAILWWPVITYVVGVVLAWAAGFRLWRIDDDVEPPQLVLFGLAWPYWLLALFE